MIAAKTFEETKDIYVSPNPQGHRPTWIWWALVESEMYVQATKTSSSWYQAALKSLSGRVLIAGQAYRAMFEPVEASETLRRAILDSFWERYHYQPAQETYESATSRATTLRVTIVEAIEYE